MHASSESTSIIFAREINVDLAAAKLTCLGAHLLDTKACWLLRESSVVGLLTVTFYSNEEKEYKNNRIGFIDGEWVFVSADRNKALDFASKAETLSKSHLPENSAESLYELLRSNEFNPKNIVHPNGIEVSQTSAYRGYVDFDEDEPASRYSCW
ncbi:hypothetical protein [Legionella fallonii]|uniref:Uncharacterized protein n=1 Tax=Legionella fallonii LLAP-10 TaxID=1212491 RepID=A0A098G2J4_9GAMM|nr:hypothetical protein [Legionella fallonii]CEG56209.1 protein of unknown function [Legionella fallonii LLAP-10]